MLLAAGLLLFPRVKALWGQVSSLPSSVSHGGLFSEDSECATHSSLPPLCWRHSLKSQGSSQLWRTVSAGCQPACALLWIAFCTYLRLCSFHKWGGMWWKFTFHSINLEREGFFFFPFLPQETFFMTFLKHLIFWAKSQMIHSLPSCRIVADFQSWGKDSLWNKCKVGSETGKGEKTPYYSSRVVPGGKEPSWSTNPQDLRDAGTWKLQGCQALPPIRQHTWIQILKNQFLFGWKLNINKP